MASIRLAVEAGLLARPVRTGQPQSFCSCHQPMTGFLEASAPENLRRYWRQLDWDDIRLRINSKTAADVERALNASQLTRDDMMALCYRQPPVAIWNHWPNGRSV